MIVRTISDRSLGSCYLYDARRRPPDEARRRAARGWPRIELAPMKPISYKSRDGLTIHGYLTLPLGVAPRGTCRSS